MRNWNFSFFLLSSITAPVSEYLWGIETIFNMQNWEFWKEYQNTYEELKHYNLEWLNHIFSVSEYLWGIETSSPSSSNISLKVYQNTYEELKLIYNNSKSSAFWCIRIPMRNWNNSISKNVINPKTEYQNTYEELKRHYYSSFLACPSKVSEYLWGIETSCSKHRLKFWNRIRIPMRNWNLLLQFPYQGLVFCIRIPMRNWNRIPKTYMCTLFRYQNTYEELKPGVAEPNTKDYTGYQNIYEELKL